MRRVCIACCAALAVFAAAGALWAQDTLPPHPGVTVPGGPNSVPFPHGPGFYFSLTKIGFLLFVFWCWVYSSTWVSEDAQQHKHPWSTWNPIVVLSGLFGFLLVFAIPMFWAGSLLMLLAYGVPLGIYIYKRNVELPPDQRVLTPAHIRFWLASRLRVVGIKIKAEAPTADDQAPVKVKARGGESEREDRANGLKAKQIDGYRDTLGLLAEVIGERATQLLLDVTREQVAVRRQVDGMWEVCETLDRQTGDAAVAVFKTLCNLKVEDRRNRQAGQFDMSRGKAKYQVQVISQGTQTGERVLVKFDDGGRKLETLEQLGMRDKMQQQLLELLKGKGIFVFSGPPQSGVTTTVNVAMLATDRYMRSWLAIEDAAAGDQKLENVEPTKINLATGETPAAVLTQVLRQYPDGLLVRELPDAESLRMLVPEDVAGEKIIITTIKAREPSEAVLRMLMLQDASGQRVPPGEVAPVILGVLTQRLIRVLCSECKEAFEPPPQLLQKLGLPPERVQTLYRAHTFDPENRRDVCHKCGNRGFRGRTAIFELLPANDEFRQTVATNPRLDALRAAARKAGLRTAQEEGILLVAKGLTSLEELKRVLQEGQQK